MTVEADSRLMPDGQRHPPASASDARRDTLAPLASYVLRVTGRPATLRYELHEVRTGARHRFASAEALAAFLRGQGATAEPAPDAPDESDG